MELFKISTGRWMPKGSDALYWRMTGNVVPEGEGIRMHLGSTASFDTYFNSFSSSKYARYTEVENVEYSATVSGQLLIKIFEVRGAKESVVVEHTVDSENPLDISLKFSIKGLDKCKVPVRHFVVFESKANSFIHRLGGYECENEPKKIMMAAVICTFRRELYVKSTLNRIAQMLDDKLYAIQGGIEVIVVDNGRTLFEGWDSHPSFFLTPNRNLGGSGGFARGMYESLKKGKTHTLLMDDDETIDPNVLYKTLNLLRVLRDEYSEAQILGGMLLNENPVLQFEAGSRDFRRTKGDLDFSNKESLVENEREEKIDYGGWWYFGFRSEVAKDNLPLPFFIRIDDVEFGIRNKSQRIIMNGIGVWHDSFPSKANKVVEHYYAERNALFMWAIHNTRIYPFFLKYWYKTFYLGVSSNYDSLSLFRLAVRDFLKGIEFIRTTDSESNHKAVSGKVDKPGEHQNLNNGPLSILRNMFSRKFFENILESTRLFFEYIKNSRKVRKEIKKGWRKLVSDASWEERFRFETDFP